MNERQRILELVKKGVLSSEEALILIEKTVNEEENNQHFYKNNTDSAGSWADMAEKAAQYSSELDHVNEEINRVNLKMNQQNDYLTLLLKVEEAEPLTDEQKLEKANISIELDQLDLQIADLTERKSVLENLLTSLKENSDDKQQKTSDYQSTAERVNKMGDRVVESTSQFTRVVKDSFKNIMDNLEWHDIDIRMPGMKSTKFEHEFLYPANLASIIDVKLANGNISFKTWNQPDLKIVGQFKLYGKMDTENPFEAFLERSQIDVDQEQISFQVPNKRVRADLIFYLPDREYDHVSIKSLNGQIDFNDFRVKDLFVKNTNGDLKIETLKATMLEVEAINGLIKAVDVDIRQMLVNNMNGDIRLEGAIYSANLSTVNGNVKATLTNIDNRLTAASVNGNVKVALPTEIPFKVHAKTHFGEINNRINSIDETERKVENGQKIVVLKREYENQIPVELTLNTTTGSIYLKDL